MGKEENKARVLQTIKAITFDVQGTCVDFVQPLMRVGEEFNHRKNMNIDWATLSFEWRELYRNMLDEVISGQRIWMRVDHIYRQTLDTLLENNKLSPYFSISERDELNMIWSHLEPWPDSREGLGRLRQKFVTSTLSNAGMATMVSVVKHARLPFDALLTAELAHDYKPSPAVYQLAVDYLGYRPDELLMVACHKYDLNAARSFGMRTAFVTRPLEFGPHGKPDLTPEPWFDLYVDSFITLAKALGA
ncbi:haloacid dehalogenase type II [Legionella sp. 27fs60]|uniref:(S)-2-haloacid dehalogenase n=2 Tax=Legionella bononiensis TaxID=2793102 RepID=A0ABS1W8B9_9GAMM|nr:haloacid dehalogenase type II [Legionella bononiensis]MBL7525604.1 haloacid dehalogenase type II [Legionella bononiensis]MBL7561787.1 haloacid dehalogenase type II [Legionella bononiensis]